ncbi:hypothetical protein CG740_23255 [Streptomyces sp. CB01201]|uniref:FDXHR family putative zinc-binding protein n=1 Tax=Streptomyces sp. CB01201 TaxID=2020324 RepID=UPI000C277A99|nr:hypothetical protein [Streptomyces sp. CB01201]PJN00825.1 hypothetical protein CG740_23255 [Streptomyces sp. CB01201]
MSDTQEPQLPYTAIRHPQCGQWWTGPSRSHCPACCRTFSCDSAADRHRQGRFGIDRQCVDPATIGLVAVTKPWGQMWQNPGDSSVWAKSRDADQAAA